MKYTHKLALLVSLGALAPVAASAKTPEQAYLESCRKGTDIPVPISVVAPEVSGFDAGETVQVEFVVEATGNPSAVSVKSSTDRVLADAVVDAVRQWRFTPALRNGTPVATRVVLPIRIVAPKPDVFAAN